MLFYPQLQTGNVAQFPLKKHLRLRTVENQLMDGSRVIQRGLQPLATEWELRYNGLSDIERIAIEQFHSQTEGRLQSFTFLDPTSNLLRWSEDLSKTVWTRDAGLAVTGGIASPGGGVRASRLTNNTAIAQKIKQTVSASGSFTYCLSVKARATQPSTFFLFIGEGSSRITKELVAETGWRLYWVTGNFQSSAETLEFGVETSAGQSLEIFGMQAGPQPGPGDYVRTGATSGVNSGVRFTDDRLSITTSGPDDTAMTVRLTTTG